MFVGTSFGILLMIAVGVSRLRSRLRAIEWNGWSESNMKSLD